MKKMETAEVEVHSFGELKYGKDWEAIHSALAAKQLEMTDQFFTDPQHSLKYTVTMYYFAEGKHLYTIKSDERRDLVNRKRALAARLMKEERYKQAIKVLEVQIEYASLGTFAEDKATFRNDLLSGYLNCSLCFWKLEKWRKMVMATDKALEIDPLNEKAAFRKALALRQLQDYEPALQFIKESKVESKELVALRIKIEADLNEVRQKEKKMFKNLFQSDPSN